MSTCSLDAHIIIPKAETKLDALVKGGQSVTCSLDAIIFRPSVKLDAIIADVDSDNRSVAVKVRPAAFRNAIFNRDA